MKKIKIFVIFFFVLNTLSSCGTVKDAFSTQKKNSNDEFLVEKKNPLILPPNFDELPEPSPQNNSNEDSNQQIKDLIIKKDNNTTIEKKNSSSKNLEEHLLGKIKNN